MLPIKCLLTAAFVTYLSEEFEDERQKFLEKWGTKLLGENFDFTFEEFLCTEREQFHWLSEGLLSDKLSIQNAAIILKVMQSVGFQMETNFFYVTVEEPCFIARSFIVSIEMVTEAFKTSER